MNDIILHVSTQVVEEFIRIWRRSYRRRPIFTVVVTLVIAAILGTGLFAVYQYSEAQRGQAEQERLANLDLHKQLEELNEVEASLNSLLAFINDQRKKVAQEQEVIEQLEEERSQLEPVVQTDKGVVETILKLQEERTQRDRWKDILIGFVSGFISEIIVGIVLAPWLVPIVERLRARRNAQPPNAE